MAATKSIASQALSRLVTLTFGISQLPGPRNWAMAGGSNGYRAVLVRRQLTTGLTSSLPGTAGLPPFISSSTSYPEPSRLVPATAQALLYAPGSTPFGWRLHRRCCQGLTASAQANRYSSWVAARGSRLCSTLASAAMSSASSAISPAPRFSSRWRTEDVPGISRMPSSKCSSHARAI
jgi:hypothetical protein